MSRSKETPAVGPSGPGGPFEPPTEDGLTAPPGCPPPAMPTASPGTGEPPRARRLVRHLPRAVLILFLIAIPIVFHSVLLPFVLAIFFAYLIYPVVRRLERIPIGRRHPPRWLAVITVYAMLFVVGWWTIPPLITNIGEQLNKLVHDVPTLFEKMQSNRKKFETWIASAFEVDSLSEASRVELFADVNALSVGIVQPFAPPEGLELPPLPPPPSREGELPPLREPAAPTIVQFMPFNLNFGPPSSPKPVLPAAIPSGDETAPVEDAAATAQEDAVATPVVDPGGDDEQQIDPEPPRRFEETQATAFKEALRDTIDAELEKPGSAKGVPEKVEREIVPELALKELGLPPDDPQVALFARNCGARVAAAIARENYGKAITAYFESAVISARAWVQRNLNEAAGLAGGLIAGLVRGIFDFFMVLMLTAFFLVFFPRIRDYLRDLFAPQYRDDYAVVMKRIDTRLSGAIRGQVIICIVNAVLTFPGLWFIGVSTEATNLAAYAVLLSVIAGVLSMIPIFGVILSTVPMVILALAQGSVWGAFLVIGWICVIHAIEAYVLNPNILGHSASMNPIIVVFALLAGKQLYGLVGALLAVPVASVLVSLFGYYRRLVVEQSATEQGVAAPADPWGD